MRVENTRIKRVYWFRSEDLAVKKRQEQERLGNEAYLMYSVTDEIWRVISYRKVEQEQEKFLSEQELSFRVDQETRK